MPTVLLGFFYWLSLLRKHQDYYARQLIERWRSTAALAAALYIVSVVVAIAVGLFAAGGGVGLSALEAGNAPPAESLTVIILLWASFTFFFGVWLLIVHMFRKLYMGDSSDDKFVFRAKWLSMLNWGQIAVMFVLTILFMPIARVLLSQFLCSCSTDATTGVQTCVDANYASNDCFPHQITVVQGLAFVFGLVYIIGLPLFYIRLINRTVKLVLSTSRVYQLNEEKMTAMAAEWKQYNINFRAEQQTWSSAQLKKKRKERAAATRAYHTTLAALRQQQQFIYYSVVNQPENVVPASSLYSSFTYRYRFWKIIQMAQKLLLIVISLFIPAVWGELKQAKVVSSGMVIVVTTSLVIFARPYNDKLEDVMDATAGLSNTINALVAIGLVYEWVWLTSERSDIILLVANGCTLFAFAVALVFVPLRAYRHAKKEQEKEKKEAESKEHDRMERQQRLDKKDKERKDKDRAEAMKSGKGAVGIVSEAEFERLQRQQMHQLHNRGPSQSQSQLQSQPQQAKPHTHASQPATPTAAAGKYPVASAAGAAHHRRAGSLARIEEKQEKHEKVKAGLAADESLPAPLSEAQLQPPATPVSPLPADDATSPHPRRRHQRSSSLGVSISQLAALKNSPPTPHRHSLNGGGSSNSSQPHSSGEATVQQSPMQRKNSLHNMREANIASMKQSPQSHGRSNSSMDIVEATARSRHGSHWDEVENRAGHQRSVSHAPFALGKRLSH